MLDSLECTVSRETVNSLACNGKKPVEDELTVDGYPVSRDVDRAAPE